MTDTPRKGRRRLYLTPAENAPPQPVAAAPMSLPIPLPAPPMRSPVLRRMKVEQTVRDHALLAVGAMVIPIPFLDMAAEAAIQLKLVRRLCELYEIDFAEERAKAVVAAAIGGFSAGVAAGSLLRYASFATYFSNFWPSALFASAITYGIGQVFIHHFEAGGNLHDLDSGKAASILREKAHQLRQRDSTVRTTQQAGTV